MALSEASRQKLAAAQGKWGSQPQAHFRYDLHQAAASSCKDLAQWEKIARAMAFAVVNQDVRIEIGDQLVGRVYHLNERPPAQPDPDLDPLAGARSFLREIDEQMDELVANQLVCGVSFGHISWFWDRMLKLGISGMQAEYGAALRTAGDKQAAEFYTGVLIMLDAVVAWNDRHIARLEEMGLSEMAEICRRVPLYPAGSFHEALQSFFMGYLVVMLENPYGGNGPGRLDYYLWPYLEKDLRDGACTLGQAREWIDELFIRIDERIHAADTWVEAIVVGGTGPDGSSAINPLSRIMVESIIDLNITHPSVYIRLPAQPPADFLDLCAAYLLTGANRAQILSDPAILRALTKNGVAGRDAVAYACGGCMEIGIQGMTSDFLFSGWYSVPKMVELFSTGGICLKTGKRLQGFRARGLAGYDNFDAFYADFIAEAGRLIRISHQALDRYSEVSEQNRPSYLVSSMIDDCLARGRNMHAGGARYHDYGTSPVGMPNAADYLYAIKRAVFEDRICTADELLAALKANFTGFENLQARLKAIPKYGQEDEGADAMARTLMLDFGRIYGEGRTRWGGRWKIVVLTFVWAPIAGALLGATADGNPAGKPVAHGVTPQSSSMNKGLTAAINSCLALPFDCFSGGAAAMWDLDPAWASEAVVRAVVTTYLSEGGQIFQGNTTDVRDLIDARSNPQDHQNLIVRVGGYSARFVMLDPNLQNEIIARVRHRR